MALPYTRDLTFIPGLSKIPAVTVNAIQDDIVALWNRAEAAFGDGADGSATLDGTATVPWATKVGSVYTMTRDAALVDLTLTTAVTLRPSGYRLFGRGTLTTVSGQILLDGANGAAAGVFGAAGPTGSLLSGAGGGSGGASGATAGGNATATLGGAGGAGGNAGGAAGGTATAPTAAQGSSHLGFSALAGVLFGISAGTATPVAMQGGAGGGGAQGNGTTAGGGGGAGGGVGIICFGKIVLQNNTDIRANGGIGGNGVTSGCGGGGGGGGGYLRIICREITVTNGVMSSLNNCAGGAFGFGGGTGTNGIAGATGTLELVTLVSPVVSNPAVTPVMTPGVYTTATLPDPATFPVNSVIVNSDTNQLLINYTTAAWTSIS